MLRKLLLVIAVLAASAGSAFAKVDVNKADRAVLDGIKGIGPKMSKAILDERKKGGDFKDWDDFESRVKGVGKKNAVRLSDAGLTVNGKAHQKTAMVDKGDKKGRVFAKETRRGATKDESKK